VSAVCQYFYLENYRTMISDQCEILEALSTQNIELAENLIKVGKPLNTQNALGVCALHLAVEKGLSNIVKLLLERGANPNIRNEYHEIPFELLEEEDVSYIPSTWIQKIIKDLQDLARITALHIATKNGSLEIATLLIKYGANVDIKDPGGCTPLHWAAIRGHLPFIKLLVENRANVNIQDIAASTPLHEAVRHNHMQTTQYLLEQGGNPLIQDITGASPLTLAKSFPNLQNLLLRYTSVVPIDCARH